MGKTKKKKKKRTILLWYRSFIHYTDTADLTASKNASIFPASFATLGGPHSSWGAQSVQGFKIVALFVSFALHVAAFAMR